MAREGCAIRVSECVCACSCCMWLAERVAACKAQQKGAALIARRTREVQASLKGGVNAPGTHNRREKHGLGGAGGRFRHPKRGEQTRLAREAQPGVPGRAVWGKAQANPLGRCPLCWQNRARDLHRTGPTRAQAPAVDQLRSAVVRAAARAKQRGAQRRPRCRLKRGAAAVHYAARRREGLWSRAWLSARAWLLFACAAAATAAAVASAAACYSAGAEGQACRNQGAPGLL